MTHEIAFYSAKYPSSLRHSFALQPLTHELIMVRHHQGRSNQLSVSLRRQAARRASGDFTVEALKLFTVEIKCSLCMFILNRPL